MTTSPDRGRALTDVFSAVEIARAAGATAAEVRLLIAAGEIATVGPGLARRSSPAAPLGAQPNPSGVRAVLRREPLVAGPEALRAARRLRTVAGRAAAGRVFGSALLARASGGEPRRWPVVLSAACHVLVAAAVLGSLGVRPPSADTGAAPAPSLARLVFVAEPGPGGGGGGGGLRQPLPPPRAERRGQARVDSPVPPRPAPPPRRPDRRPLDREALTHVVAPLVSVRAGEREVRGLLAALARPRAGAPGRLGGAGGGAGRGAGPGTGAGVGPGAGGGTGGGPYRPGSGIVPPRVLREVRPDYTEAARLEAVEGDVLLEVIVLADGSVGDVRVVRGLGFGLDERAVRAMRRWRFHPAERRGVPVSVVVEVAMSFRLL